MRVTILGGRDIIADRNPNQAAPTPYESYEEVNPTNRQK